LGEYKQTLEDWQVSKPKRGTIVAQLTDVVVVKWKAPQDGIAKCSIDVAFHKHIMCVCGF